MKQQTPPFAIQVEPTEGCNLFCSFCGINGIREENSKLYKFMTVKTARIIAKSIAKESWSPRIEFAMHGEPLLNPKINEIVNIISTETQCCTTLLTNGILLNVDKAKQLFANGLNILGIDDYVEVSKHNKKLRDKFSSNGIKFSNYPEESFPLHKKVSTSFQGIVFIKDIRKASKGSHSNINSHCGGGTRPLFGPLRKRCAKPFREMAFRWDGNVALCCNDFRGIYKIGNIHKKTITEIWNDPKMDAARKILYNYQRNFLPCSLCNALSVRVGLLPDKLGREVLLEPTAGSRLLASEAIEGESYTKIIPRSWEK